MKTETPNGELLKKGQLAKALNISPRSIENYMARGWVPYVRVGRCVRFDLADVLATLKARGQCNTVLKGEVQS
jgi:hypothetical protein